MHNYSYWQVFWSLLFDRRAFDLDQIWIEMSMLDAALYRKKIKQDHRKTDPEKRERCGFTLNKPSAISQSDAHISMLSHVNEKTDRYPESVKTYWLQLNTCWMM